MTITSKSCIKCGLEKPVEDFYANPKSGGYSVYCKPCQSAYNRSKVNRQKKSEYNQRWIEKRKENDPEYGQRRYEQKMQNSSITEIRADRFIANLYGKGRQKLDADVTRDVLINLFTIATHCDCCGKPLRPDLPETKGQKHYDAPSIDRIDNRKGYSLNNIAVVCLECNTRKRDLTLEDLEMLANYIRRHTDV